MTTAHRQGAPPPPEAAWSITEALGVQGWRHLDAPILAALATEAPVLLIGPHGTAKTYLIERIGEALGLILRHYNASLINYDDLVGIPLPEAGGERLRFVSTPGSIWDAEFVFFDEISRCRPDLQNKMFPVIHERRVAGIRLEALRHRWAAMNPPAPEHYDASQGEIYLGSESLDPALLDRFPFILPVPTWRELEREDRRQLVMRRPAEAEDVRVQLAEYVEVCASTIPEVEAMLESWLPDYIVSAVDLFESAKLRLSPRRAHMLARALCSLHAARLVLYGPEAALEESAELTLLFALPQTGTEVPPSRTTVLGVHRQAWEIASLGTDDNWRRVLEEPDPVKRVVLGDQFNLDDDTLGRLVTQALGSERSLMRRMGLAAIFYVRFHTRRNLTPAAWEPTMTLAAKMFQPRYGAVTGRQPAFSVPDELRAYIRPLARVNTLRERMERNFVLANMPDIWSNGDWAAVMERFRADCDLFGISDREHRQEDADVPF